jgi:hypothetical protein
MLRSLLLIPVLIAMIAACSPAEPPLLIDGAQPPASQVVEQPPVAEVPSADDNSAAER